VVVLATTVLAGVMLLYSLLFLVAPATVLSADTLKGLVECMNHQDCVGAHRKCSHQQHHQTGTCVCEDGYVQHGNHFACVKKGVEAGPGLHTACRTDEDCNRNEVCMSWRYDPAAEFARKISSRLAPQLDRPEKHQFCIDAWIIYKNHLESLDEPRTGGGLRSRNFDAEEYFFGGRRPHQRVHQQYIGFAEDMMLILFLVCILATLVTVHRAACYRSLQDARRNTPLRHLLPIAEDRPPPYSTPRESVDGLDAVVSPAPKPLTETPPPSYEEALYRQSVQLPPPPPGGEAGALQQVTVDTAGGTATLHLSPDPGLVQAGPEEPLDPAPAAEFSESGLSPATPLLAAAPILDRSTFADQDELDTKEEELETEDTEPVVTPAADTAVVTLTAVDTVDTAADSAEDKQAAAEAGEEELEIVIDPIPKSDVCDKIIV